MFRRKLSSCCILLWITLKSESRPAILVLYSCFSCRLAQEYQIVKKSARSLSTVQVESPWRLAQPSIISNIVLMKGQGKVSGHSGLSSNTEDTLDTTLSYKSQSWIKGCPLLNKDDEWRSCARCSDPFDMHLFISSFLDRFLVVKWLYMFSYEFWLKMLICNVSNAFLWMTLKKKKKLVPTNCNPVFFSFMSRVWVSALLEAKILHEEEWGYLSRRFSPTEQQQQMVDWKRVSATRNTTPSRYNENDRARVFVNWWCVTYKSISRDWAKYIKKYCSWAKQLMNHCSVTRRGVRKDRKK